MGLRELSRLVSRASVQWWNDRAPRLGAALAYYGAFSIAPALALVVAIASLWFGEEAARGEVARQLRQFLGEQGSVAVQAMLASAHVSSQSYLSAMISVLLLLFGSFGLLSELQDSLDSIWNTPPRKYASWGAFLLDKVWLYVVLLAVAGLFVALILANSFAGWMIQYAPEWSLASLWHVINMLLSWATAMLLFAVVYKVLPNLRLEWKELWLGAAVTAVLFLVGKWVIGRYLAISAVATVHGAAGAYVALLIWLYYSAQVFLFGAELTQAFAEYRKARGETVTLASRPERKVAQ